MNGLCSCQGDFSDGAKILIAIVAISSIAVVVAGAISLIQQVLPLPASITLLAVGIVFLLYCIGSALIHRQPRVENV